MLISAGAGIVTVSRDDAAGAEWPVRLPLHWRLLWSPAVWEAGEDGEVGGRIALHQSWAAAQCIKFSESGLRSGGVESRAGVRVRVGSGDGGGRNASGGGDGGSGCRGRRAKHVDGAGHDRASHLITRALKDLTQQARGMGFAASEGRGCLEGGSRVGGDEGVAADGGEGGDTEDHDRIGTGYAVVEQEQEQGKEDDNNNVDLDDGGECECGGCGDDLDLDLDIDGAASAAAVPRARVAYTTDKQSECGGYTIDKQSECGGYTTDKQLSSECGGYTIDKQARAPAKREACDAAPPRLEVVRRALLGCSAVVGPTPV